MMIASDLEGTLTTGETWRGVGRYISSHGRAWVYRRFLAAHIPRVPLVKLGLLNRNRERYRWVQDMPAMLQDYAPSQLAEMGEWVVENEMWPRRRRGVVGELLGLLRDGSRLVLVSGTYQPILDAFARRLGPDVGAVASPLEMRDGRATGRLSGPLNVEQAKVDRVLAWLADTGAGSAAIDRMYGDTLGDLPMMELCRQPVCVYPNPALRHIAVQRGWRIMAG